MGLTIHGPGAGLHGLACSMTVERSFESACLRLRYFGRLLDAARETTPSSPAVTPEASTARDTVDNSDVTKAGNEYRLVHAPQVG
jgi:hypothetical protein